jgi:hypothetical protein
MKGTREIERIARRTAQAAVLSRFVAPLVREALSDRKVRVAAGDTYEAGRRMYADVKGSDAKAIASRVARDERLQNEIAALVRTATKAIDTGIASGRRRMRRRIVRSIVVGAGAILVAAAALKRKFVNHPSPEQTFDNHVAPPVHAER